jgi:hypothetical protein
MNPDEHITIWEFAGIFRVNLPGITSRGDFFYNKGTVRIVLHGDFSG